LPPAPENPEETGPEREEKGGGEKVKGADPLKGSASATPVAKGVDGGKATATATPALEESR
jgi:hypothetical protein